LGVIDFLVSISQYLPEIKKPEKEIPFKQKMLWTIVAVLIFFILGQIMLVGLSDQAIQQFGFASTILASEIGTLITAGIGPIVTASIFLQLFLGAQLIKIDLHSPEGRMKFQSLQKILAVALCFIQGLIYVASGMLMPIGGNALTNPMLWFVTLQIALGSLILLYLDEIVSKYGIGSGISLFIAAGVSGQLFWQIFQPPISSILGISQGGILWQFFFITPGDWILLLPIIGVIGIFLVVVFAEGMHVNIPISFGQSGMGGRYPVKFLYVSNMPVILAMALFMNFQLWAMLAKNVPILGSVLDVFAWATMSPSIGNNTLFSSVRTSGGSLIEGIIVQGLSDLTINAIIQATVFMSILIVACIVFGWFWVQMGNQSTEAVAAQLERSGMQIPGFRRDKRVIEKVLDRYIPPITVLGSIFVAILAGFGDIVLSGITSGTGILLTVGIVYRLYEEIAKNQAEKLAPLLAKMGGK